MKRFAVVIAHILIWLLVLGLPLFFTFSSSQEFPHELLVYYILSLSFYPIIFYLYFSWVIPETIYNQPISLSTFITFSLIAAAMILLRNSTIRLVDRLTDLDFAQHHLYGFKQVVSETINTLFIIFLATVAKLSFYWYREKREKTELALQEHKMELDLLKAQINPHFFFNTLNNIYSLVYKKSDDAPAAVMKLSEIMRYLIYESKSEMVPLEKEVEQLQNYIELERLRARDPGFIEFESKGSFSSHIVPPMLLISFAENAFKHGKRKVANPGIHISIAAEEGLIKYTVTNYILDEPHNNHTGEGIGMQNTRRRLELLYPKCHKLDIKRDRDRFTVKLVLSCKS
ncbi:MAG: histidine kinase [Bacteroidales bacterium]